MPNGGSDNCGTCWFNAVNEGKTADQLPEPRQSAEKPARCVIRDCDVDGPYCAYCANHQYHNPNRVETPIGPVYTIGLSYTPRIVQIESPDSPGIRGELLRLLEAMPETPEVASPTGTRLDDEVIKQLMKFRETAAVPGLRRVAAFDPLATAPDDAKCDANRISTVAWAMHALGVIARDDAVAELEACVMASLRDGRMSERTRQLAPVRRAAVIGLMYCESAEAAKVLRKASLDPDNGVASLAVEAWFGKPQRVS